ncbi:MAG: xanthine dehydrogenase family protein molybdopterin-binding subunit [Gammaproteobacteria bacterium]|nr:xanthine dehydrogenase family protein molybdopterin-binding subunit [Gammaproteobacteria bacterium]
MNSPSPFNTASFRQRALAEARYAADIIPQTAILAEVVRCPHPHALVKHIDSRATLAVPGVLAVLTAADFEGTHLGHIHSDEPVLSSVARYVGDGVAAVAARDRQSLMRGIEALRVDYEVLPHAITIDDALASPVAIHDFCADNIADNFQAIRGDWQAVKSRVALWVENTFETAAVPHAYLEPRACLVRVDSNRLELVCGSHAPSMMADSYRPIVAGWGSQLEVVTPAIGGSFGAKWGHPTHLVCLLFAQRLQRDVAMVLSRRDDMIAGRTRAAMRFKMRIGATAEGELVAKETVLWSDNGAYSLHGPAVMKAAAIRGDNLYRFSAVKADAQLIYTNNMPSECFRGFGITQSTFAQEQLIDELAHRLNLDPVKLRLSNIVHEGDTTVHGWKIGSCGIADCLDSISKRISQHRRGKTLPRNERYRTGYGLAAFIHCIGNRGYDTRFDRAFVKLAVLPEGGIRISSGEVELGCGTVEVLTKTVARELAVSRDQLEVVLGNTATGPHGMGSFASRTSFFVAMAAEDACRRFKQGVQRLMVEFAMPNPPILSELIEHARQQQRLGDLEVTGVYQPTGVVVPDESGYGNISAAYTFGAHGCCIQVDTYTGKVTVRQYWAAHDAGTIVNSNGAQGQVIGGVIQGIGFALTECASVAENGQLLNPGYLDNRVPTFADATPVEVLFINTFEKKGPAGAKTIGEPPIIPVAACIANAVHDAVGVRIYRLPITSERLWRAMNDDGSRLEPDDN